MNHDSVDHDSRDARAPISVQLVDLAEPSALSQGVWDLVDKADSEFVPPLSSRGGTTEETLTGAGGGGSTRDYVQGLRSQRNLVAVSEGSACAMMSFIPGRALANPCRPASVAQVNYVSTVIVGAAYRRRGLARRMYHELLSHHTPDGVGVATRTWSGNVSHLRLLDQLDFRLWCRLVDDRGPGVDTVYYLLDQSQVPRVC